MPFIKRFHTYVGREMRQRLLQYPYMYGSDFRACPPEPGSGHRYSRQQDYKFMHSFQCMIFYQYSDYSMSQLEPTGNCIRGIIHRTSSGTPRTLYYFFTQVFSYPKHSAQLRMLHLLIRTFGQISLHNLHHRLIDLEDFNLDLYQRMVYECFPDRYVVEDEAVARRYNCRKRPAPDPRNARKKIAPAP